MDSNDISASKYEEGIKQRILSYIIDINMNLHLLQQI
jgi:hypothetical protein